MEDMGQVKKCDPGAYCEEKFYRFRVRNTFHRYNLIKKTNERSTFMETHETLYRGYLIQPVPHQRADDLQWRASFQIMCFDSQDAYMLGQILSLIEYFPRRMKQNTMLLSVQRL